MTAEARSTETEQLLGDLRALVSRQAEQIAAAQTELAQARAEIAGLRARLEGPDPPAPPPASTGDAIAALRAKRARLKETRKRRTARRQATATPRRRGKRTPRADRLVMDETRTIPLDPAELPADARFKGYVIRRFQDVELIRRNTAFRLAKYYSPSERKTFQAPLPAGYFGEFGPDLRAFCLTLYWDTNTSEAPLRRLLLDTGVRISVGQIANLVAHPPASMHAEKRAMHEAGVQAAPYAQMDGTFTACDGESMQCHVVVNEVMTSFVTTPTKERVAAIGVVGGGAPEHLLTEAVMEALEPPSAHREALAKFPRDQVVSAPVFEDLITTHLSWAGKERLRHLREATALAALKVRLPLLPPVLMTDDAKNYAGIFADQGLCWIHRLRTLDELNSTVVEWQTEIESAQDLAWAFYERLKTWAPAPDTSQIAVLEQDFDATFVRGVACPCLQRVLDTVASKKRALLAVLRHPALPLHNNGSEIEQRRRVRKRDVSFGPRSAAGLLAWDTMQSLVATARKLGLNFMAYVSDRIRGLGEIPPLAEILRTVATGRGLMPAPAPSV